MVRHALARVAHAAADVLFATAGVIHAVSDRIEPERPEPEIQYVYVYAYPPSTTTYPVQPWQSPITWTSTGSTN
jgi:hypothetical protein